MMFGWLTSAIWMGCSGSDKSEEIMAAQNRCRQESCRVHRLS